eukprot:GABV01000798.1.p1 GENE.GABV01000798.1~~GABV01000798.1.p1  ORF type:complete len:143 (+),score=7.61 GABV01000798.1:536-964(+)
MQLYFTYLFLVALVVQPPDLGHFFVTKMFRAVDPTTKRVSTCETMLIEIQPLLTVVACNSMHRQTVDNGQPGKMPQNPGHTRFLPWPRGGVAALEVHVDCTIFATPIVHKSLPGRSESLMVSGKVGGNSPCLFPEKHHAHEK